MRVQELLETLHPLERKVIPFLRDSIELEDLAEKSGMKKIEAMRALQWLENKNVLKIKSVSREIINLDENGRFYLEKGLPERRFLENLDGEMSLSEIKEKAKLNDDEVRVCLGILKSKYAISILGDRVEATEKKRELLKDGFIEEKFLKRLPLKVSDLRGEDRTVYSRLSKRKRIVKKEEMKLKYVDITNLGKEVLLKFKKTKIGDLIEKLSPKMLKDRSWKGKGFRRYDIKINVPEIYGGKRHPYSEFIQNVRETLIKLGFKEMEGPIIELEFFNFDALYQPQNHPARDWSATYRIREPRYGRLPDRRIVKNVKHTHENGWKTGSKGWGYEWSEKISSQLMPRAHDTAISPRYLAKGVEVPGRYFNLVRCFRPDVIDSTHGVEFNQLGGFVIDKELSFRHLLGLLNQFVFETTGIEETRFVPDYFPFTEPSVQISAKHPKFGWVELAGAGVFRPELTEPLGVKEPVIAWGFGIDRLAMIKLNIKDIRNVFSHDIEFLRKSKKVL
ncbi:MAG: phenylalanine--tRNA ligase subunit alpha [Candidatus Aenigmarchaeota archaeon]|nr:phenylalanine--tRNA ligase subunit alpha [Candidatus Aenigmarchaeota archaeon]